MTNDFNDELSFHVADGFEPLDRERQAHDLSRHTGLQWPSLRDDSTEPPTDVVVLTDELLRASAESFAAPEKGPLEAARAEDATPAESSAALEVAPLEPVKPLLVSLEAARAEDATPATVSEQVGIGSGIASDLGNALQDIDVALAPMPPGPTTTEALRAIRPRRRWVTVAIVATLVVALFGGLLLRESSMAHAPVPLSVEPLTAPPLLPALPELELVEFPAPAPTRPVVAEEARAHPAPARRVVVVGEVALQPRAQPAPRHHSRRAVRAAPTTDLLDAWQ